MSLARYIPGDWRLFIDIFKYSLKYALLHNGNKLDVLVIEEIKAQRIWVGYLWGLKNGELSSWSTRGLQRIYLVSWAFRTVGRRKPLAKKRINHMVQECRPTWLSEKKAFSKLEFLMATN